MDKSELEIEIKEKADELLELIRKNALEGKSELRFKKEFENGNARMILKFYGKERDL